MNNTSMQDVREKRRKAWQIAEKIGHVSRRTGIAAEEVSTQSLLTLPDWCLQDLQEIRVLQRMSGALYFAPAVYHAIDGSLLRSFRDLVGDECFKFARNSNNLFEHKPGKELSAGRLPINVMAAGSSVLLSTLPDDRFVALYEQLIGPRSVLVDKTLGKRIHAEALVLTAHYQENIVRQ